ncbi:hypothetical protein L3Q67_02155 [Saccharothrix sp. AJ9571]|nr:hypothetical protein L3Q67_02155 [Saccharothrix sp. AJ9571]
MTADGWEQLITSRAWLRRYSLSNILMILQQCPHATDVRPMSEWKREGYPLMRKGTHKIKIWKPRFHKVEAADGEPASTESSTTQSTDNTAKTALHGFMLVPVVDVSQLDGNPSAHRPAPPQPIELSGDAPAGLWDGIHEIITNRGYTVDRDDCGDAYGRTIWSERRVSVRADIDPAQAAKTLTHEIAHILCDHETRTDAPRHLGEVEAESVACIVAAVCGLDTLAYSVPYVAGWAVDRDTARASAQRVLAVADTILSHLDAKPRPPSADASPHILATTVV